MKALTIKNPYSYLICYGIKDIENRTFNTKHRGTILIHTSLQNACNIFSLDTLPIFQEMNNLIYKIDKNITDKEAFENFNNNSIYMGHDSEFYLKDKYKTDKHFSSEYELLKYVNNSNCKGIEDMFLRGSIIGQVDIVDVIKDSNSKWAVSNNFHYVLDNPILFEKPILQVKGKLGFWDYNYS